jgi:hypothetical protein
VNTRHTVANGAEDSHQACPWLTRATAFTTHTGDSDPMSPRSEGSVACLSCIKNRPLPPRGTTRWEDDGFTSESREKRPDSPNCRCQIRMDRKNASFRPGNSGCRGTRYHNMRAVAVTVVTLRARERGEAPAKSPTKRGWWLKWQSFQIFGCIVYATG